MIKRDFFDNKGIRRRVIVPDENAPLTEGIPVSLPIEKLYDTAPTDFVIRLVNALFARGLIEPEDFFKAGAAELTQNALLDTLKFDALNIVTLAKEHTGR